MFLTHLGNENINCFGIEGVQSNLKSVSLNPL